MAGSLDPRGPVAAEIAGLWWLMLWLGLAAFVVFAAVLVAGLLRRRSPEAAAGEPAAADDGAMSRAISGERLIVWLGVVMPAAVIALVFVATLVSMRAMPQEAVAGALQVDVVGRQFSWQVRYPDSGRTLTDELRIPVGRPVALRLRSADVIHSFWVPQLAGKLDVMPGRTNTLVLQADEPGTYRGVCAEFCGLEHAHHVFVVIAESEERFTAWLEQAR